MIKMFIFRFYTTSHLYLYIVTAKRNIKIGFVQKMKYILSGNVHQSCSVIFDFIISECIILYATSKAALRNNKGGEKSQSTIEL